ncbi:transcriptional repressor DicA [compost metagenome]
MDANALKVIMSDNIKQHLKRNGKTQTDLANDLSIPETTVSNWINAKTYPRIDKIQAMANYFRINRSDLTEKNELETSIKDSITEFSDHETELLRKYNSLDDIGKYTIDTTLDAQYERCTKPHLEVVAAHNDDYSEEQQKLMREDMDMLERLHKKKHNK